MKVNCLKFFNIPQCIPYKNCNNQYGAFNISFSGTDKSLQSDTVSFSKKDLLSQSEDIIFAKTAASINNPENYLGSGTEAAVYRIKDTDYCVRVLNKNKNKISKPISFNLTEADKINHVVAKLGNGATIMKFYEGYPSYKTYNSRHTIKQESIDKIVEDLPISAFQKLLKQICYAKDNGMIFDCSWQNVIINPKDKTITAIDFYELNEEFPEEVHPLRYCYASLIYNDAAEEHKKDCLAKLLLAGLEEMKPGVSPIMSPKEFGFCDFINAAYKYKYMTPDKYTKLLKNVFSEIENLKEKENSDINIKSELNGKIKIAESIIKQTLLKNDYKSSIPVIKDYNMSEKNL